MSYSTTNSQFDRGGIAHCEVCPSSRVARYRIVRTGLLVCEPCARDIHRDTPSGVQGRPFETGGLIAPLAPVGV